MAMASFRRLMVFLIVLALAGQACSARRAVSDAPGAPPAVDSHSSSDHHAHHSQGHGDGHSHSHPHSHAHSHAVEGEAHARGWLIHSHEPHDPSTAACACEAARMANGWCPRCQVGHIAGVPIKSAMLFDTLDAHGHDIDAPSMTCAGCREALAIDGFCEQCRWGFVDQRLYVSRLTHSIALGKPTPLEALQCATCRGNAGSHGWCEACERGMLGNVAFRDRAAYARAAEEYGRLLASLEMLERCQWCAVVMFTGGRCPDGHGR